MYFRFASSLQAEQAVVRVTSHVPSGPNPLWGASTGASGGGGATGGQAGTFFLDAYSLLSVHRMSSALAAQMNMKVYKLRSG